MWINREEYEAEKLRNERTSYKNSVLEEENRCLYNCVDFLKGEIKKLSEMISAETKDCAVGPWCKDCLHYGIEYGYHTPQRWNPMRGWYNSMNKIYAKLDDAGSVQYCKKHLHELCPEFDFRGVQND